MQRHVFAHLNGHYPPHAKNTLRGRERGQRGLVLERLFSRAGAMVAEMYRWHEQRRGGGKGGHMHGGWVWGWVGKGCKLKARQSSGRDDVPQRAAHGACAALAERPVRGGKLTGSGGGEGAAKVERGVAGAEQGVGHGREQGRGEEKGVDDGVFGGGNHERRQGVEYGVGEGAEGAEQKRNERGVPGDWDGDRGAGDGFERERARALEKSHDARPVTGRGACAGVCARDGGVEGADNAGDVFVDVSADVEVPVEQEALAGRRGCESGDGKGRVLEEGCSGLRRADKRAAVGDKEVEAGAVGAPSEDLERAAVGGREAREVEGLEVGEAEFHVGEWNRRRALGGAGRNQRGAAPAEAGLRVAHERGVVERVHGSGDGAQGRGEAGRERVEHEGAVVQLGGRDVGQAAACEAERKEHGDRQLAADEAQGVVWQAAHGFGIGLLFYAARRIKGARSSSAGNARKSGGEGSALFGRQRSVRGHLDAHDAGGADRRLAHGAQQVPVSPGLFLHGGKARRAERVAAAAENGKRRVWQFPGLVLADGALLELGHRGGSDELALEFRQVVEAQGDGLHAQGDFLLGVHGKHGFHVHVREKVDVRRAMEGGEGVFVRADDVPVPVGVLVRVLDPRAVQRAPRQAGGRVEVRKDLGGGQPGQQTDCRRGDAVQGVELEQVGVGDPEARAKEHKNVREPGGDFKETEGERKEEGDELERGGKLKEKTVLEPVEPGVGVGGQQAGLRGERAQRHHGPRKQGTEALLREAGDDGGDFRGCGHELHGKQAHRGLCVGVAGGGDVGVDCGDVEQGNVFGLEGAHERDKKVY